MKQSNTASNVIPEFKHAARVTGSILDEFFSGFNDDEHGHWKDLMFFLGLPQEMGHSKLNRRQEFIKALHSKNGLYNPFLGERITNENLRETVAQIKAKYRERRQQLGKSPFANDLFPDHVKVVAMLEEAEQGQVDLE